MLVGPYFLKQLIKFRETQVFRKNTVLFIYYKLVHPQKINRMVESQRAGKGSCSIPFVDLLFFFRNFTGHQMLNLTFLLFTFLLFFTFSDIPSNFDKTPTRNRGILSEIKILLKNSYPSTNFLHKSHQKNIFVKLLRIYLFSYKEHFSF